jgi:pimeloyl-ACP methyl ester carboxylesterase
MLLAYSDDGPGPVVVLLHGFPLDRSMWEYQRTGIGSTYRVIAPDLRGHGETAAPEGVYHIDDMAEDVVETLVALGIHEPIVLGGLSMGGYVALALAHRHPHRLRGLMLIDTRASADTPQAALGREELAQRVLAADSAEPAVEAMLPRLFGETTRLNRPEVIAQMRERMLRTPARAVAGALRGMAARLDRTAELGRIAVPTLVMVGAEDVLTPPSEAKAMADAIPNARYVEIPGAGHLAPLENPSVANGAMFAFLESLS